MDKPFFRRLQKMLKHLNVWGFLLVAIISGLTAAFSLRHNNLQAIKLRDQVLAADKADGDVEAALRALRKYVYAHMNTSLSSGPNAIAQPIQLKYRYERLVKAEQDRINSSNGQVYAAAQADCERRYPNGLYGSGRIPCVTEYITTHSAEKPAVIPDSLYKFDFVSPTWSPDVAGWSLVISAVSFALFAIRFGMGRWVKAELHDL